MSTSTLPGDEPISGIPEESKESYDKEDEIQDMMIEPNENEIKTQSAGIKTTSINSKEVAESKEPLQSPLATSVTPRGQIFFGGKMLHLADEDDSTTSKDSKSIINEDQNDGDSDSNQHMFIEENKDITLTELFDKMN